MFVLSKALEVTPFSEGVTSNVLRNHKQKAMTQQTLNKQYLLRELEQTTRDLLQAIAAFDQQTLNIVPFEGSWTAGQVSEHLLKAESGIPEVLTGPVMSATRPIDQMVPMIESVFLDFTTKMKTPEFILPSDGPHDRQVLLNGFEFVRITMQKLASTQDLTQVCTSFPFPQMGELTRWEWLNFALCHSKRHTRQLKNIYQHIRLSSSDAMRVEHK
jgi:hypothetical protein